MAARHLPSSTLALSRLVRRGPHPNASQFPPFRMRLRQTEHARAEKGLSLRGTEISSLCRDYGEGDGCPIGTRETKGDEQMSDHIGWLLTNDEYSGAAKHET